MINMPQAVKTAVRTTIRAKAKYPCVAGAFHKAAAWELRLHKGAMASSDPTEDIVSRDMMVTWKTASQTLTT